jgi:phage baseplate assembly protein gpV
MEASGLSTEPSGRRKPLELSNTFHPPSVEGPDLQARAEECVAGARVASGGGHADQLAIGCQFEHRLRVGFAHEGELLRSEPQLSWQQQVRLALVWNGGNVGSGGGGSDRHLPGGGGSAI